MSVFWLRRTTNPDPMTSNKPAANSPVPITNRARTRRRSEFLASLLGMAALLLVPSAPAQTNVIMNDDFSDGSRTNTPINSTNSYWQAQTTANMNGVAAAPSVGPVIITNASASSRFFMAYFTTNSNEPSFAGNTNAVDLNVGQMIKSTLVFTPTNIPAAHANSQYGLRFGLFNLTDGGGRTNRDANVYNTSSGTVAGTNVLGYFIELNFLTTFNSETPMQFFARTNTDSNGNNLLSTASTNINKLGSGPTIDTNAVAGFVSGTTYTLEMSVARYASSNVFKARIAGGPLSLEQEFADTNSVVHRFDSFGIRANRLEDCCEIMAISQFKVETMPVPSGGVPQSHPPFSISSVQTSAGDNLVLTWPSSNSWTYHVLSRSSLISGDWTTNATVTGTGSPLSYTNPSVSGAATKFFRIQAPPQ